jgi:hypothetical protein
MYYSLPATVAERSKAWTVFARSDSVIVGSNLNHGIGVCCVCAFFCVYSIRILGGGVESIQCPLGKSVISPTVSAPGDCEDGEFGGMKIGRGNRSIRRKPTPAPLCRPQSPFDNTRSRTRTTVVGSQRLTPWAIARRFSMFQFFCI